MIDDRLPARAVSPGSVLKDELTARGWTQAYLAKHLGRPEGIVAEIIRGAMPVTRDVATALGAALGTSAELWLNLENRYRLTLGQK